MGGFNALLSSADKQGRGAVSFASSSNGGFGGLMELKGLIYMGFVGNPFTWTNKKPTRAHIKGS